MKKRMKTHQAPGHPPRVRRVGEPLESGRRSVGGEIAGIEERRRLPADLEADAERRRTVKKIKRLRFRSPENGTSLDLLRELRS